MSRWMDGLVDELVSDQEFRGEVRIDVAIDFHALNLNQFSHSRRVPSTQD